MATLIFKAHDTRQIIQYADENGFLVACKFYNESYFYYVGAVFRAYHTD